MAKEISAGNKYQEFQLSNELVSPSNFEDDKYPQEFLFENDNDEDIEDGLLALTGGCAHDT